MMEIQQHDGVVVEVAGFQQGFAKRCGRREMCHGRERERLGKTPSSSSTMAWWWWRSVAILQGFAKHLRERRRCHGREGGTRVWGAAPIRLPTICRGGGG